MGANSCLVNIRYKESILLVITAPENEISTVNHVTEPGICTLEKSTAVLTSSFVRLYEK